LFSARVNPASRPMLYGDNVQGSGDLDGTPVPYPPPFNQQQFGNDFLGVAIAPDGSVWGSFNQDCGPSYDSAPCMKQHDHTAGFAASLR
jgi:hypothetical protein